MLNNQYKSFQSLEDVMKNSSTKLEIKQPTKEASLFLYNLNNLDIIELNLIPNTLAAQYDSKLVKQTPFGILQPINYYVGGGSKSVAMSFDLHEDLNNEKGSIYILLDKLKKMSEPIINEGALKPPLVYFQLGNHFAGKGHINVGITYNTPYSQGRYKYINISLTVVFHEEYEQVSESITEEEIVLSGVGVDMSIFDNMNLMSEDSYSSFFQENIQPDFTIKTIFADKKFQEYFNIDSDKGGRSNYGITTADITSGNILTNKEFLDKLYNYDEMTGLTNEMAEDKYGVVLKYYVELGLILNSIYSNQTIANNLWDLFHRISDDLSRYKNATKETTKKYFDLWGKEVTIYYIKSKSIYITWLISLNEEKYNEIVEGLTNIMYIVLKQREIYNILVGAGN